MSMPLRCPVHAIVVLSGVFDLDQCSAERVGPSGVVGGGGEGEGGGGRRNRDLFSLSHHSPREDMHDSTHPFWIRSLLGEELGV